MLFSWPGTTSEERSSTMKTFIKLAGIATLFIFVSAYAMASGGVPEKYDLEGQLEKISVITDYTFMGWNKVDNQSFVLQTGPSDYYLVVLSSPSDDLPYSESLIIDSTNNMVRPGFNNVIVHGSNFNDKFIINRIYKFKDTAQMKEIELQLTGENNG